MEWIFYLDSKMVIIDGKEYKQRKRAQIFVGEICEFFHPKFKNKHGVDMAICPVTKLECEKPVADNPEFCNIRSKEVNKK